MNENILYKESAFYSANVTKELAKYHKSVEVLPASVISQVQSLQAHPPADAPYSTLKAEILRLTSVSDRKRYHQLLKEESPGDRKPSELLRRMRSLLGDMQVDDKFVKEMFLERLPADVQAILASSSQDLTVSHLAEIADRMIEEQRFQSPSVAQISSSSRNRETSQPENRCDRFPSSSGSGRTFYVCDTATRRRFLMDTEAQISVVPPTAADRRFPSPSLHLQAANCSSIPTFGSLSLTLNVGLRRSFTWIFVIADVPHAIVGSDFLAEFDLLVDCRRVCLLDHTTDSSRPKTAVTTPFGLFEFIRMPFGLRNAAQTFQRSIDHVLRGLPFVYAYIDDLLVASRNEEEHKEHLTLVFNRLDKFGVVINPSKCVLDVPSLESVDSESLRPLPSKVEAVRNFPPPTSKRQLQRFLGMVSFYRRFLPNCADLMLSLTNMLSGAKGPLELTGEALTAFDRMENSLADATLLTHPAPEAQLSLMVDASTVATRYSTFGRELLAIYLTVKHFRHFFEGRDFSVFTDHKPLTFAFRSHSDKYTAREIAHLDYISQFITDIRHINGTKNEMADMLSRPSLPSLQLSHRIDLCAMTAEQQRVACPGDESVSGLQLKDIPLTTGSGTILCDVSIPFHRPFVPASMRRAVFQTAWTLTLAETIVKAFVSRWVVMFGAPVTVTTDRGVQFESELFQTLLNFLGCTRIRTTAHHPAANSGVERFHRQLKTVLSAVEDPGNWSDNLPLAVLVIRAALKSDLSCSAAELVFRHYYPTARRAGHPNLSCGRRDS
nr:unnamed protein product [Spirometra erinaceieuropaei]